jgi:hypothetical protein
MGFLESLVHKKVFSSPDKVNHFCLISESIIVPHTVKQNSIKMTSSTANAKVN